MFVADAHSDTLSELGVAGKSIESCAVQPERLARGGVGLQTFAMWAGRQGGGDPWENGQRMIRAADRLGVPMITGALPHEPPKTPHGVFSIEGGEMLGGSLERLRQLHQQVRIRMIALTWNYENEIGYPASGGTDHPLKPFGRELVSEMDRLGILVDVSHLNEAGFYDAAERAKLPIIASHSNLKRLCPHPRNLTDDQARLIIQKKGFIGVNFYPPFLTSQGKATLEDVLRHIDGVCELGGAQCVGFGSDFDGIDVWPEGLGNPADFAGLIERLLARGYKQAEVEAIAGGNLWRVLKQAEAGC